MKILLITVDTLLPSLTLSCQAKVLMNSGLQQGETFVKEDTPAFQVYTLWHADRYGQFCITDDIYHSRFF